MIQELIPKQNFEIVRDAIGYVLKQEFISQSQKENSRYTENTEVYLERTTPIQNEEEIVVNIVLASSDYSNKTQKDSQGKTFFNIDIYSTGQASNTKSGSLDSAEKLHKYIGLIRYILSHTEYKTLGLPPGIIGGTQVENFSIIENKMEQDSDFFKMATVYYSVRIQENQSLEHAIDLNNIFSQVKLELTELGYIYEQK